jgi:hypothetical protein
MNNGQFETLYTLPAHYLKGPIRIDDYFHIKPSEEVKADFPGEIIGFDGIHPNRYRLRLIGEVDVYHAWRGEAGNFDVFYRLIDDALCTDITHHCHYSLRLSSGGENYPRKAFYKAVRPQNRSSGNEWRFGIWFKKENVHIQNGGCLSFTAEIRYRKEGRNDADISGEPDEIYTIDIADGTCGWTEESIPISVKSEIASLFVYVTGERFTGTVWLENPYMESPDAMNALPPLVPSNPFRRNLNWLGFNLSRKEWPEFEIRLNDNTLFSGELFQRVHRWPSNEIDIPAGWINKGDNHLSIRLVSEYREALPYKLRKVEFVRISDEELSIISSPQFVADGEEFSILISIKEPGMKVFVKCDSEHIKPQEEEMVFECAGLNVIRLKALSSASDIGICIKSTCCEHRVTIERIVEKIQDNVLTGTCDSIWINQNISDMEHYLSWYLHNNLGNSITFRPVYKWGGSRTLNPEVWTRLGELLTRLGLYYCLMPDGRELPGLEANPNPEFLEGPF